MVALLAAGQSRRFGDQDKLAAMLGGKPLGLHAANRFARSEFAQRIVISSASHSCAADWQALGYQLIANADAAQGIASSVRLAAERAQLLGAKGLCIALADMPLVSAGHITNLLTAFAAAGGTRIVASLRGEQSMPPAIFPPNHFPALNNLTGDSGAGALLSDAEYIAADAIMLHDVDSPQDLAFAAQQIAAVHDVNDQP